MSKYFNTPILLVVFNRPDITQQVFDQIKAVKPKFLYVAADGARPGRLDDIEKCKETREIINQVDWDCTVKTLFRDENLGCGLGVCSAITWFFEHVEQGIILEDDCFPDISFFNFCGELLEKYKDDKSIFLISGSNFQNGHKRGNASYFFSNYTTTWGWASWRRAWENFNYDITDIPKTFHNGVLDHVFHSSSEKRFWKKKFKLIDSQKSNIWDFQWLYTVWLNRGVGITPNVNLVMNLGMDNSGTHFFLKDSIREQKFVYSIEFPLVHPQKTIDREADIFTYKQIFSHSLSRFIRLVKENGIWAIIKYIASKIV
jgi:hypothetical protein